MQYAPVLIPTLNRYEHLKKCLDSLSCCTWANETEVYVALDYPPSEKYVEGWMKNKEFLENCGNMGFKKLHVIQRNENYGTWNPGDKGNERCLRWLVGKTHDRFITSEDDNVFSPNFLEYMNKGLELFENDDSVINLCAFRWYFPIKDNGNTFFRSGANCTPWGMGYWTKKQKEIPNLNCKWFRQQLSIKNLIKVYKNNGPSFMNAFLEFCNSDKSHQIPVDLHMTLYMTLMDKHQIIPVESLVKNIGIEDMGKVDEELQARYDSIPTSCDSHFEFKGTGYEYFDVNQKLYWKEFNWQKRSHYVLGFFKKIIRLIKYR